MSSRVSKGKSSINMSLAMTPQEHAFFASDSPVTNESDWFIPVGIKDGLSPELILQARESGWARNSVLESGYRHAGHIGDGENFAIRLAPLDPETYATTEDP